MHYIRSCAEMFSKLWPKVSDQRHLLVSQGPVKSGTTGRGYITTHQAALKKDGKEKAEALQRMKEQEK